jgi:hypothetical protein
MGFLAIAARALTGRRPRPVASPSPIWPTTTSASSTATPPHRRTFAELAGRGRTGAPPDRAPAVTAARAVATPTRPPAVIGAGEGSFGSPVRKSASARPAASRPAPSVGKPPRIFDFSHLDSGAVFPVDDGPRRPEKPNPKYSAQWQRAFKIALGTERPAPAYKPDLEISRLWKRAFTKARGGVSR